MDKTGMELGTPLGSSIIYRQMFNNNYDYAASLVK